MAHHNLRNIVRMSYRKDQPARPSQIDVNHRVSSIPPNFPRFRCWRFAAVRNNRRGDYGFGWIIVFCELMARSATRLTFWQVLRTDWPAAPPTRTLMLLAGRLPTHRAWGCALQRVGPLIDVTNRAVLLTPGVRHRVEKSHQVR